jgi:hypothetical protein
LTSWYGFCCIVDEFNIKEKAMFITIIILIVLGFAGIINDYVEKKEEEEKERIEEEEKERLEKLIKQRQVEFVNLCNLPIHIEFGCIMFDLTYAISGAPVLRYVFKVRKFQTNGLKRIFNRVEYKKVLSVHCELKLLLKSAIEDYLAVVRSVLLKRSEDLSLSYFQSEVIENTRVKHDGVDWNDRMYARVKSIVDLSWDDLQDVYNESLAKVEQAVEEYDNFVNAYTIENLIENKLKLNKRNMYEK